MGNKWTKEYKAEYAKKYNEEHQEQIKANRRYWYEHNRERVKRVNKAYRDSHPDKVRECIKKYYEAHKNDPDFKEKQKQYNKKWLDNNREKYNAYQREYRKRKAFEELGGAMMNETELKQIEEMAKVIKGTEQLAMDMVGALPSPRMYATDLYNKGYRRQSEVAREIFEEIEEDCLDFPMTETDIHLIVDKERYDELKKKYTEEKLCTDCKHFVGCECFDGQTCDQFAERS